MEPLIITATANICWLAPDKVQYPKTPEEITQESLRCREAGATIRGDPARWIASSADSVGPLAMTVFRHALERLAKFNSTLFPVIPNAIKNPLRPLVEGPSPDGPRSVGRPTLQGSQTP